jgi:hypothetical protein
MTLQTSGSATNLVQARRAWLYFVMSLFTSFGFAMGLYLAAQERQLRWNARSR